MESKTETVSLRIDAKLLARIDAYAKKEDRTRSAAIVVLLKRMLDVVSTR